ncbi:hypothetical protein [Psychromonas sp. Urea-02u-13]|uniref:hypothetical protein n=1 Tax=Psychromonas sp. Urea-02u-13 TaxID=2058326 RepID=UPI000C32E023|nr:hypothetical protein [Psychromonas sp. Urea-02u-13]PKG37440.1 hypothetical protein CXF74_18750 [Psychromonas sp. Urea-02u-13]
MSAKKHKRKAVKHNHQAAKKKLSRSLLNRYPKMFLFFSLLLIVIGILLLTMGYVSNATVGSSMILIFFGLVLAMFANAALPRNRAHIK